MARRAMQRLEVPGPEGRLEGVVEIPDGARGLALLLHPHPLHQGTMDNKVVHTLARACRAVGMIAMRFNFRGVGGSEGSHGGGPGEQDDAVAVATWMRGRWPGMPLYLGGFSFGSMVALGAAARIEPEALITVAPPVQRIEPLDPQPACPWLIIQGDADEIVDADDVVAWLNALAPGPELRIMSGVDHFFHGRLPELRDAVVAFLTAVADRDDD